jgi:hypothetical protein
MIEREISTVILKRAIRNTMFKYLDQWGQKHYPLHRPSAAEDVLLGGNNFHPILSNHSVIQASLHPALLICPSQKQEHAPPSPSI